MPEGDRHGYIALIIAACTAFLIAAGAVLGITLDGLGKVHQGYAEYQKNANAIRERSQQEIEQSCFNTDRAVFSKCVSEKLTTYYEAQAANQDLQAQKDMAWWAAALFGLSFFQTTISIVGIYFIARSVRQASDGLQLAAAANENAREIGHADISGFLICEGGTVRTSNYSVDFDITVKNVGKTHVHSIRTYSLISIAVSGRKGYIAVRPPYTGRPEAVFAGRRDKIILASTIASDGAYGIGDELFDAVLKGMATIEMPYIVVEWENIFGRKQYIGVDFHVGKARRVRRSGGIIKPLSQAKMTVSGQRYGNGAFEWPE